jgi:hypothetical protein
MLNCALVDCQTINYGNHSVSDFLIRYGFVPKGQMRSVDMEVVPWPLRGILTQASLGDIASQPHTDTERELHSKLLEHRHHDPGYGFVRLFQEGLDSQSNFALRLMHLRQGDELSGYAIVRRLVCYCLTYTRCTLVGHANAKHSKLPAPF